ncbi:MAG: Ribonuclease 3 [Chloroflexi bacterium]|jgi:ribonuclease-3|nr:Ribonuclease 3 [Chloroflexota bacterium]
MTQQRPNHPHLSDLERQLGLTFENRDMLHLALVHRSYLNERNNTTESNERLEFLGDAVLSLVVADYLFRQYPDRPEGELTDLRSALVRRETLAKWASRLEIGQFLYLGKGEAQTGGRNRALTLASAFEAVLGAIFLERGMEQTAAWLRPLVETELVSILNEGRHYDYKGLFQKTAQKTFHITPTYHVVNETGLEHERVFEIEARLEGRPLGRGHGLTKLIAQQAAARAALPVLQAWIAEMPSNNTATSTTNTQSQPQAVPDTDPNLESETVSDEDKPV